MVAGAKAAQPVCRYKDMRSLAILSALAAAFLLSACARARVTTHIQSDGSWTRTVALTGQRKPEGVQAKPTLEDTFVIPTGPGWKSTEETKDSNRSVTLERSFPAGATLQGDVSIKNSEPGKLRLVNLVTIKAAGPHQLEYRETLHWTGAPSKFLGDIQLGRPGSLEIASSQAAGHRRQCPRAG